MNTNLIKLDNVVKSYLKKVFTLNIKKGEKVIVIGENGSGKSTLIKLITNYINKDLGILENKCESISYLEEVIELPQNMRVDKYINIMESLKKGVVDNDLKTNLNVPMNKYIFELSKGNKQKLAILTTFIGTHDLIVLDEPLNGLDTKTTNYFINYLKDRNETIIVVTHYNNLYNELRNKVVKL